MSLRFAKCPTWWVRVNNQNFFPGGRSAGVSIAGLKCLFALSLTLEFHSLESDKSITDIESLTGLSRPMVIKGLRHLEAMKLIVITRGIHAHSYRVIEPTNDRGWAKVPYRQVSNELRLLLNRGAVSLLVLKTYLFLLARRPNESGTVSLPYETILAQTQGQRSDVRRALDILVIHKLIKCEKEIDLRAQNVYTIIGI